MKPLVNLRTSAVTVLLGRVRRTVIAPPLSFFISYEGRGELSDRLRDFGVSIYEVADDSWVECKELPSTVSALTDDSLATLQKLNVDVLKVGDVSEVVKDTCGCVLISCDRCLDLDMFNELMLKVRYVVDLRSVDQLSREGIRGRLRYYFRDHLLVYGVGFKDFQGLVVDVQGLRKILTYGKPLVYVDSKYLVLEMPNNSLVFTGGLDLLDEFLVRALIYSC